MIMFICGDSHGDTDYMLESKDGGPGPFVLEARKRKAEIIIFTGDIAKKHLKSKLFGDLKVICALNKEQLTDEAFQAAPPGWVLTRPGDRIYKLDEFQNIYVGHYLSFEFLAGSDAKLAQKLNEIRAANDCVRWLFSGHTHHQIYKQGHVINFVNPGAIEDSFDGHEFAVIDTANGEIVFGRIPKTTPVKPTFSVGVISDSLNISEMDPNFWQRLAEELGRRGAKDVIHVGNLALCDVGRKELAGFQVHYYLRPDQKHDKTFDNWHLIPAEAPVVDIKGYRFYVQLDLGADLLDKSEFDMHKLCLGLRRKYPETSYVLCGLTNDAFLEEGEEVRIINPGDILKDRNFCVVCLPRAEITFGHVPIGPLPKVT